MEKLCEIMLITHESAERVKTEVKTEKGILFSKIFICFNIAYEF